MYSSVVAVF